MIIIIIIYLSKKIDIAKIILFNVIFLHKLTVNKLLQFYRLISFYLKCSLI